MSADSAELGNDIIKSQTSIFDISSRQWLILLMVQLSTLIFGMTITLANVVLPQIRGSLSATQDEISWVITLNLVATAVATPLTGWLASRLGWRGLMLLALAGFSASSLLCGFANSLPTLILFRVGQGLFGAPIMPLGQAILLATFPRNLHATVMVIWGAGSVVGPVFGPIFGSMVAEAYDWRSALPFSWECSASLAWCFSQVCCTICAVILTAPSAHFWPLGGLEIGWRS
jgi:DHA2 family multidrug resistance protein